ncbi:peptidase U32 family protein [Vibrio renipiscarius]|uniref:peptidase U32 family protein n=1 Tax=Vibrio renipiscarius TaxID=1461322 RepID=UPI00354F9119
MTRDQFELLAPGGDLDSIKAAIAAGADAVYCGLDRFNARNRATNLTLENLRGVLELAHKHNCKIFLTLNVMLLESEIPSVVRLLNQLNTTLIDGVIIQDLGLGAILKQHFLDLDVHASTQLNTHNDGQILFLNQLGVSRVNLSRELNITEIKHLAQFGRQHNVLMEVFVHGSYCIGFSGLCYMSSAKNGASGNRGRCSQPCRDQYQTTPTGSDYPLNMKDNSAFNDLEALADAGVYSLKVEGRIKKFHYVYTVVDNWRKQIDKYCDGKALSSDTRELYTVFNRDFTNGFLQGEIGKDMFINNPRDHAVTHFSKVYQCSSVDDVKVVKQRLYDDKSVIIQRVEDAISDFDTSTCEQPPLVKKTVHVPALVAPVSNTSNAHPPKLSVLISKQDDAVALARPDVDLYFEMPMGLASECDALIALFQANSHLIPWFQAVLIGDDYKAAERFLTEVRPSLLVTNNSGVGYLAQSMGIDWIAGPQMNSANSYTLQCLKEQYQASGAFISDELSFLQIRKLVRPEGFRTFYNIYHPNTLLTSRQCLFQQTEGCKKIKINKGCLKRCSKRTSVINMNGTSYVVQKLKGSHNSVYAEHNVLNLDIVKKLPEFLTDVLVDLRDIQTETRHSVTNTQLIDLFLTALSSPESEQPSAFEQIKQATGITTNKQYAKGL